MKKKSLIVLLIVAFVFIFGCNNQDTYEGYKVYSNSDVGFSIQYPEGWNVKEGFAKDASFESGSIVVFQAPSEGKADLFMENVHIFTEALPDSVENIDDYYNYSMNYLPSQLREMVIRENGKLPIDGKPSSWIIFDYVSRLTRVTSIGYMFYIDNKGLVITCTARPEDFMSFRRTFEKIATSIKFE